jgi:hypothetical protein
MALLNLTAAAQAAGVNRSTVARALKNGRLSATNNEMGERCIDTAELMRVFGPLKADAQANAHPLSMQAIGVDALVEVLQKQLRHATEREQQGRERELRLLAMLEVEQAARRDMEQKLLSPPPPPRSTRLVILLIGLALSLLALFITQSAS